MGVNLSGANNLWLSVLMNTPDVCDFTTGDRYWIEQEDQ
jgi:hypothetical protein